MAEDEGAADQDEESDDELDEEDCDDEDTQYLASGSKRLINCLCDSLLCNVILVVLVGLDKAGHVRTPAENAEVLALNWGVIVAYYLCFETLFGRTPGKWFTGTRVVTQVGGRHPNFAQIVVRTLVRLLPLEALSFLARGAQGLHDRWSHTCVVDVK